MAVMATALLIVDVQQFYLDDLPADFVQRIVNHEKALSYDEVLFTVFQNTPDSNLVHSLKWTKCDKDEDAALPAAFHELVRNDNVFKRSTYSAFKGTGLHDYLQSRGVDRLIICGTDTDACVLATAFEAFDLGYHVKVEFSLTFSGNDYQAEAEKIIRKTIESRD